MLDQTARLVGFIIIVLLSAGVFFHRSGEILAVLRSGKPDDRWKKQLVERFRSLLVYVGIHKTMFRFTLSGFLHLFIFYGFVILFTFIVQSMGEALFGLGWELPLIGNQPWLNLPQDLIAVSVLFGIALALYQRLVRKPARFEGSHENDAFLILGLIATVIITTLLTSSTQISLGIATRPLSPVSSFLASIWSTLPLTAQQVLFEIGWWGHLIAVLSFLPYLLYSKHMHVLIGIPNVFLRDTTPAGRLEKIDLDDEDAERFGASVLEDFSWKHMLDFYACTECGRCTSVCPATMAGTPLNPKHLIMDLRAYTDNYGHMPMDERPPLIGEHGISEDVLWSCTTCRACVYECPLFIEHVDDIVDMRRALVLMEGSMPEQLSQAFNLAQRSGNPWGNPTSERMKWAEGLDVPLLSDKKKVDVLYWIGCAGAYDPAAQKTSQAVVKILHEAGVDFAVLGDEEKCNCEWARRAGEENLFQAQTDSNIGTFEKYEFNTIITHCPHCFNTFKNEYPDFGGNYNVMHHSQYISALLESGQLKPINAINEKITYHDSCYLGRYNDEYDSPRKSLEALGGVNLVEMERSRDKGLCCGGGGAQVWFENEAEKNPVGEIRLAEAMALEPDTVATACPFCTLMISSAAQTKGVADKVKIKDFAEIVAQSL